MEKREKFSFKFIFYFLFLLFFLCTQSIAGNNKIKSFSKSKKILFNIYETHPITFYCNCFYKNKKPDFQSCGYKPYRYFKRAGLI